MSTLPSLTASGLSPSPILFTKRDTESQRISRPLSSAEKSNHYPLSPRSFQRRFYLHFSSPNWTSATEDMDDQAAPLAPPAPACSSGATAHPTNPVLMPTMPSTDDLADDPTVAPNHATISALPDSPGQIAESLEKVLPPASNANDILDIATKIFNGEFVSLAPEEYTLYLAGTSEESTQVRECFMSLFTWDACLLESTRMLCAHTYLRAESQEIDRILTSFTSAYLAQHPENVFKTADFEKIYVVVYLMILLNTALHNSNLSRKSRMSQQEYVRSTLLALQEQDTKKSKPLLVPQRIAVERTLARFYDEISANQLQLKQTGPAIGEISGSDASHQNSFDTNTSMPVKLRASMRGGANNVGSLRRTMTNGQWSGTALPGGLAASLRLVNLFGSAVGDAEKQKRVGLARALAADSKAANRRQTRYFPETLDTKRSFESLTSNNTRKSPDLRNRSSRGSLAPDNRDFITTCTDIFEMDLILLGISFTFDTTDSELRRIDSNGSAGFDVNIHHDSFDLQLEIQGSPYLKEGLLKLQIQNNDQQDFNDVEQESLDSSSALMMSFLSSRQTAKRLLGYFSRFGNRPDSNSNNETAKNAAASRTLALALASRTKFTEYFVVVTKATLILYSFDQRLVKKRKEYQQRQQKRSSMVGRRFGRKSSRDDLWLDDSPQEEVVGDGNWLNNAVKLGKYNLCSTFATLVTLPYKSTKTPTKAAFWLLTFARTLAKPAKVFLFEAGTREIAMEFVNTCNFWAARITAVPTFEESVSSIEYGWTDLDGLIAQRSDFKKIKTIEPWKQEAQGVYLSNYMSGETLTKSIHMRMEHQFVRSMNYHMHTAKGYADFVKIWERFIREFPSLVYHGQNHTRVLANFDAKKLQYKLELRKYKAYYLILGYALYLRYKLQEQEIQLGTMDIGEDINSDMTPVIKSKIKKLLHQPGELRGIIPNSDLIFETEVELNTPKATQSDPLPTRTTDTVPTLMLSVSGRNSHSATNTIEPVMAEVHQGMISFPTESLGIKISPLVKLPKTFSLSDCGESTSPLKRLVETAQLYGQQSLPALSDSSKYMSTCTIAEEEESPSRSFEQSEQLTPEKMAVMTSTPSTSI